jgi:hypothetical protein
MASKPNYNFQRAERDRAKKAAKEAKLHDRKEQAALRKASETQPTGSADRPASPSYSGT